MSDIPRAATIADLVTATGLPKRTVIRLVRDGELPGRFVGRHYTCLAVEFAAYVAGTWRPPPPAADAPADEPEPEPASTEPLSFIRTRASA